MKGSLMVLVVLFSLTLVSISYAGDFDGDSREDIAIFRPGSGLWAIRGVTRAYFGGSGDEPRPGDYNGDGIADIAIFRGTSGLWAVRGVTRAYFGGSSDIPLQGGGGQRTYDYVVKPDDGADLKRALGSDTYNSVYIPAGYYDVTSDSDLTVNHVKLISGAGTPLIGESTGTTINLHLNGKISINTTGGVIIENLMVQNGGQPSYGQIYVTGNADYSRLINVHALNSASDAFHAASGADHVTLFSCLAVNAGSSSFLYFDDNCTLTNCRSISCESAGFYYCDNLSGCIANGEQTSSCGFSHCENLSACRADECENGFCSCQMVSACKSVDNCYYGFSNCTYISASYASGNSTNWYNCTYVAASNN